VQNQHLALASFTQNHRRLQHTRCVANHDGGLIVQEANNTLLLMFWHEEVYTYGTLVSIEAKVKISIFVVAPVRCYYT